MSDLRISPQTEMAGRAPRLILLTALAVLIGALAFSLPGLGLQVLLIAAAATLICGIALFVILGHASRTRQRAMLRGTVALFAQARHPVVLTHATGETIWQNIPAYPSFAERIEPHVADSAETLLLLRDRALTEGSAIRDVGTQARGARISVRSVEDTYLLWELHEPETDVRTAVMGPAQNSYDLLPVPLLELDTDGCVRASNRAARDLLGIELDESPSLASLVSGLGRGVPDWLSDAFEGRALQRPEVGRAARANGDVYIQITLDTIPGAPERLMALLHDATELKTLEAQFVQSQKMQAIGQLAGGVAHDFNNLLTAIGGHCDLLLMRRDPTDPDFADIEQINQNANRAASLVRQLLAFSRKQNLRPEPIDLRDVLADLTHLLSRLVGETIELSLSHDPDLQLVRADKRQIEQVIMNLVVNARDAMPEGGRIEITTELIRLDQPQTRDRAQLPEGEYVVVRVVDHGSGIPEEKLSKIFEPFFTTKRQGEGTGLGLSTAYGIVKQTGGYIFADSTVGQGTTFSLFFPAHERVAIHTPVERATPVEQNTAADGVVLLVEDEPPVRAFAARALRMKGFTVLEASDAEEALEIVARDEATIDLFLSDVIMPGRDGPSWVCEALESRPEAKVIFMSGYAEESFSENQASIAGSTFLQKPFSLVELIATVQSVLR